MNFWDHCALAGPGRAVGGRHHMLAELRARRPGRRAAGASVAGGGRRRAGIAPGGGGEVLVKGAAGRIGIMAEMQWSGTTPSSRCAGPARRAAAVLLPGVDGEEVVASRHGVGVGPPCSRCCRRRPTSLVLGGVPDLLLGVWPSWPLGWPSPPFGADAAGVPAGPTVAGMAGVSAVQIDRAGLAVRGRPRRARGDAGAHRCGRRRVLRSSRTTRWPGPAVHGPQQLIESSLSPGRRPDPVGWCSTAVYAGVVPWSSPGRSGDIAWRSSGTDGPLGGRLPPGHRPCG